MSFPDALRALIGDGDVVWAFLLAVGDRPRPDAARRPGSRPASAALDAGDRPAPRARAPVPRIGGLAIVAGILDPGGASSSSRRRPLPRDPDRDAARRRCSGSRRRPRLQPGHEDRSASVAIALIPVVGCDLTFEGFSLPLIGSHDFGWARYPLTILWIVALANLVNLIDGMDALAAGIVVDRRRARSRSSRPPSGASTRPRSRRSSAARRSRSCATTTTRRRIFMGDSGALALGFLLATMAVQGVLKTAATIALVAPLLVLAVPILDTSFVVLKRLKYGRAPAAPTTTTSTTASCASASRSGGRPPTCTSGPRCSRRGRSSSASCPPRPQGSGISANALIWRRRPRRARDLVWMVYTLEILKARHLRVLGLSRDADDEAEQEGEELQRGLSRTRRPRCPRTELATRARRRRQLVARGGLRAGWPALDERPVLPEGAEEAAAGFGGRCRRRGGRRRGPRGAGRRARRRDRLRRGRASSTSSRAA